MEMTNLLYTCMCVLGVLYTGCIGPVQGRKVRSNCRGMWCEAPRCLDPVMDELGCCWECPSGENCILFGDVITANQVVMHHVGQCDWSCRCPGSSVYEVDRPNTVANCHMICSGSLITNEEIQESYNLLEPMNYIDMKRNIQKLEQKRAAKKSPVRDVLRRRFEDMQQNRWA